MNAIPTTSTPKRTPTATAPAVAAVISTGTGAPAPSEHVSVDRHPMRARRDRSGVRTPYARHGGRQPADAARPGRGRPPRPLPPGEEDEMRPRLTFDPNPKELAHRESGPAHVSLLVEPPHPPRRGRPLRRRDR